MNRTVFSVTQINRYIKDVLENDIVLQSLFIKGEISNFKRHSSGHCYFSLKDSAGVISCVMFKGDADIVPFEIQNGMDVILYGNISAYEKTGQYQLYVEFIEPVGIGALQLAFEQLKIRLDEEGLFDKDFKRELPVNIKTIAVVTSSTGAVIKDIIKVVKRRDISVNVALFQSLVQGDGAKNSIVKAIELANKWGKADVLIVARGGGSMEDLSCFNQEEVARAIFASELPVVSAIGHETDFTIADFVADVRASTPSVAGELVTVSVMEKLEAVDFLDYQLYKNLVQIYNEKYSHFLYLEEKINIHSPIKKIDYEKQKIKNIENRMNFAIENNLINVINKVNLYESKLKAYSPLEIMKKGYAIISDNNLDKINSIKNISINQNLNLQLEDGSLVVQVIKIEEN